MVTRQEQKDKRRQEILMAALHLFVRKGYAGTKVSDIAEAVGMSTGLMFHYFESKEKLYEELIAIGTEGPMSMVSNVEGDALAFFEGAAAGILGYLKEVPIMADMFVLMVHALMDDGSSEAVKEMLAGFDVHTPTAEIIRRGQQEGTIREGDPWAISIAFWSAVQGIAEELALHPESPCPESAWIVDIVRKR